MKISFRQKSNKDHQHRLRPLPSTRKDLFKDVFFLRYDLMIKTSLLICLFAIPLLIWISLSTLADNTLLANFDKLIQEEQAKVLAQLFTQRIASIVIAIPFTLILCVGLAGGFYVIKKLCYNEGLLLKTDFWHGVRINAKDFIKYMLIYHVFFILIFVAKGYFELQSALIYKNELAAVVTLLVLGLMTITLLYCFSQATVYQNTTLRVIKNSFIFTIAKIGKNILFLLPPILPLVIIAIYPNLFFTGILATIYAFYGFAIGITFMFLYILDVFDLYINVADYPQLVNKGLYIVDQEEANEHNFQQNNKEL